MRPNDVDKKKGGGPRLTGGAQRGVGNPGDRRERNVGITKFGRKRSLTVDSLSLSGEKVFTSKTCADKLGKNRWQIPSMWGPGCKQEAEGKVRNEKGQGLGRHIGEKEGKVKGENRGSIRGAKNRKKKKKKKKNKNQRFLTDYARPRVKRRDSKMPRGKNATQSKHWILAAL